MAYVDESKIRRPLQLDRLMSLQGDDALVVEERASNRLKHIEMGDLKDTAGITSLDGRVGAIEGRLDDTEDDIEALQDRVIKDDHIYSVGAGGDFETLNEGLEFLSERYPAYKSGGYNIELRIKSGFVMAEQVLVKGINLGHITITGEDPITNIDHTYLTQTLIGFSATPAFGSVQGTLPVIGQLFDMGLGVGNNISNRHGIYVNRGSLAVVSPDCGIINSGDRGLLAYNSIVYCGNSNFSNSGGNTGLQGFNSLIYANRITIDGAGENCIRTNEGLIYCSNAVVKNSIYGFKALLGGQIVAYNSTATNCSMYTLRAENKSSINAYDITIDTSNNQFSVSHLSFIYSNKATNTNSSQAVNTYTASGCISSEES